jgi:raffinose/stachyose/melibiose transport system substrate-binding protein
MKTTLRKGGIVAMAATVALVAAACGAGGNAGSPDGTTPTDPGSTATADGRDPVTLTWWHNGNNDPLLGFWQSVADEFTAEHPWVTVNITAYQNEELRNTVLPTAFSGGNSPSIFQSWGGGELAQWVKDGIVKDVSELTGTITDVGTAASPWQVDGKTYGLPYTFGPAGFWVNLDLWHQAGLDAFPTTMDELFTAWQTLAEAGITPVAVGGLDTWPAAHW